MVNIRKLLNYFGKNQDLCKRLARHLPTGTTGGLLEPQSAEEYSREIGYGDPLGNYLRTGIEDIF